MKMDHNKPGLLIASLAVVIIVALKPAESLKDCKNCNDGKCTSDGECLRGCVPGYVDIYCIERCPSNCINNTCHLDRQKGTYVCTDGCEDGYCGSGCKRHCPTNCTTCDRASCSVCDVKPCVGNGFGQNCTACSTNFEKCDKVTGQCIKCQKGFYGESCETKCPSCLPKEEERNQKCQPGCDSCLSGQCPGNCLMDLCDKDSVSCVRGCKVGFHGVICNLNCNGACNEIACAQDSGRCIHGCIRGYEETNSGCKIAEGWHLIQIPFLVFAIVTPVLCLIAAISISVWMFKRRKKGLKQEDEEAVVPLVLIGVSLLLKVKYPTPRGKDKTKAQVLERKTKDEIKWRIKGMVTIESLPKIVKKFKDGYKWITITGNAGDGKTTLGCMVLEQFQDDMDVFKLDSPDDYRHITWKDRNRMILLDDIFGAFTSDESSIQRWIPVLRTILENHEDNDEAATYDRIILTSRKNVVQDAQRFLERYGAKMLEKDRVIDLHAIKERGERMAILNHHLQKPSVDVELHLKDEVVDLNTTHGFPYCCKVYKKLRDEGKNIDIVEFFKYPLTFLNETTKVLFKSTGCRQLFKNMIRNEKFDIDTIEDDSERQKMLVAASAEEGSYIWRDSDGICYFTNDSIYQSVLSIVASEDPLFVAKYASLEVILKHMTITVLDTDSKFICLKPLPSVLETLGKRFVQITSKDYEVFGERLCFNKLICGAIVTHNVYSGPMQIRGKQHIDAVDDKGRTMVTVAAMSNNTPAVDVLVTKHADVNIADHEGRTPLHYLCGADFTKTNHRVDRACIELVTKHADVVIADCRGRTPLHYLCGAPGTTEDHRVDKACIELVLKKGPNAVKKTDKDGRTPLYYLWERHVEEHELIQLLEAARS